MVLGTPASSEAQSVPKIKYEKYTLPNGLEVILAALYPKGYPYSRAGALCRRHSAAILSGD